MLFYWFLLLCFMLCIFGGGGGMFTYYVCSRVARYVIIIPWIYHADDHT